MNSSHARPSHGLRWAVSAVPKPTRDRIPVCEGGKPSRRECCATCPAGVLLDFPLPLALYKKVARQPLTLRDLEGFDPTLGRSLRQLLDYNGAGSSDTTAVQAAVCRRLLTALVWGMSLR